MACTAVVTNTSNMQAKCSAPRSPLNKAPMPKSWSVSFPQTGRSPVVSTRHQHDSTTSSGIGSVQIGNLAPTSSLFHRSSSATLRRQASASSSQQQQQQPPPPPPAGFPQLPDFKKAGTPHFLHKQTILKDVSQLRDPHKHIVGEPSIVCHASNFQSAQANRNYDQNKQHINACPLCRRYLLNRTAALVNVASDGTAGTSSQAAGDVVLEAGAKSDNNSGQVFCTAVAKGSQVVKKSNKKSRERIRTLSDFEGNVDNLTISKVLVEGWLLKKGSGNDWLGDTKYKPRWARLLLANIPGEEVDVPVLNMYWFETSVTPSSTLFLDKAMAKPVDRDSEEWKNVHCFDIVMEGAPHDMNDQQDQRHNMRRTFAASADERNEWIYAINLALAAYKQSKSHSEGDGKAKPKPTPEFTPSTRWKEGEFSGS
mmetsp:Transcript_10402/g.15439  ORF Transcript_10402/g.15439 Transcript_10402/m.15439 type:complete len:425 (+) Transcript_10402:142-1416(+)